MRHRYRMARPGIVLGRYELIEELGEGGMATVFLARDKELRRDVAIKVLFPHLCKRTEIVRRFHREARAAAALDHPHILRVFDVGGGPGDGDDGEGELDPPYMVLELVRGSSLDDHDAPGDDPMFAEVVAAIGVAMCEALSEAHARGIIHRDIKPANIMVAEEGRVVLADFGVAHVADEDSIVTRTGALLGTPAYMSPEQATGETLDARSDLYSLGATLYQLATGSMPFTGNAAKVVSSICAGDYVRPLRRNPAIGPDLAAVIDKLMAREPPDRFATADEAGEALLALLDGVGIDDHGALLADYFQAPADTTKKLSDSIGSATLTAAQRAAESQQLPRAMALADRVLALDPGNTAAVELVDSLGSRRGGLKWVAVGTIAAVAIAGVAFALWPGDDDGGVRPMAAAAIDAGNQVAIDATAVATADPIAFDAAIAPPDATAVATNRRPPDVRRPRRPDAGVRVAPSVPDAGVRVVRAPIDAAVPRDGTLVVKTDAWCELRIGSRDIGRITGSEQVTLPAGSHALTCAQSSTGLSFSTSVTVVAGKSKTVQVRIRPEVSVQVSVSGGDAVRIAGKRYPKGARLVLKAGSHKVAVLRGDTPVTSGWVTVPRSAKCVLRDKPTLGCFAP